MTKPSIDSRLDRLVADYLIAAESGNAPTLDAFCENQGKLEPQLRRFFSQSTKVVQTLRDSRSRLIELKIQGYEILRTIGRGGMGVVFAARQESLQRVVAIKVLKDGDATSLQMRRQFEREARATAALSHPNLIEAIDYGMSHKQPYLVMSLLPASSLSNAIRRRPLSEETAASTMYHLAEGVQHAHELEVVHRDIKPGNVIGIGSACKLIDFGLAIHANHGSIHEECRHILGTPAYLAPEILAGQTHGDERTDIYSLGATYYALLTGVAPSTGHSNADSKSSTGKDDSTISSTGSSIDFDSPAGEFISTCMSHSPQDRFQSVAEACRVLRKLQRSPLHLRFPGPPSRRVSYSTRLILFLAAICLVSAGLGFLVAHGIRPAIKTLTERSAVPPVDSATWTAFASNALSELTRVPLNVGSSDFSNRRADIVASGLELLSTARSQTHNAELNRSLTDLHQKLAVARMQLGQHQLSDTHWTHALNAARNLHLKRPDQPGSRMYLADCLNRVAMIRLRHSRTQEATELFLESIDLAKVSSTDQAPDCRVQLCGMSAKLGMLECQNSTNSNTVTEEVFGVLLDTHKLSESAPEDSSTWDAIARIHIHAATILSRHRNHSDAATILLVEATSDAAHAVCYAPESDLCLQTLYSATRSLLDAVGRMRSVSTGLADHLKSTSQILFEISARSQLNAARQICFAQLQLQVADALIASRKQDAVFHIEGALIHTDRCLQLLFDANQKRSRDLIRSIRLQLKTLSKANSVPLSSDMSQVSHVWATLPRFDDQEQSLRQLRSAIDDYQNSTTRRLEEMKGSGDLPDTSPTDDVRTR